MSKNIEENYKKVYQCMNSALKYYKKYASSRPINWDAAVKEGFEIHRESPIPEFTRSLIYAVQDQLEREEKSDQELS